MRRLILAALLVLAAVSPAAAQKASPSPFADWLAVIAAGDYRAGSGVEIEVFDNARRDLAKGLVDAGFSAANIVQASVRPERYPDTKPLPLDDGGFLYTLLPQKAPAAKGCLVYLTSHGSPDGVLLGRRVWSPGEIDKLLASSCADKPTVLIVSACYSGNFATGAGGPKRMVMTAASADRPSFGCGENETYTFFDGCFLRVLPKATNFLDLASETRRCVEGREQAYQVNRSGPQVSVGMELNLMLPLYPFKKPGKG